MTDKYTNIINISKILGSDIFSFNNLIPLKTCLGGSMAKYNNINIIKLPK